MDKLAKVDFKHLLAKALEIAKTDQRLQKVEHNQQEEEKLDHVADFFDKETRIDIQDDNNDLFKPPVVPPVQTVA